jgi:6-phosphogluconolactonase (cycloisomerase 2 family)
MRESSSKIRNWERAALVLATALLYTLGCGVGSMPPSSTPPVQHAAPNTYLYVGQVLSSSPTSPPVGSIAQFHLGSKGTLTALNPSSTGSVVPFFAAAVDPSNQHLLIPNGVISEFGIGSDGRLTAYAAPAAIGTAGAFTPNGHFVLIANPANATLNSYSLGSSGALTPINAVATGGSPQYVVVDKSGKFAYVTNSNDGTVSEYTISTSGILAPNGSISTGGYNPRALAVSAGGFLYCANTNSGSVTQYSIDSSAGTLTLVNNYVIWAQPQGGPLWISFDPIGTHAYVGNGQEIAQFTVRPTGALISNGTVVLPNGGLWGAVDPSGKSLFTAGVNGTVSQFTINSTGVLIPGSSVSLGANMVAETLVFAQR